MNFHQRIQSFGGPRSYDIKYDGGYRTVSGRRFRTRFPAKAAGPRKRAPSTSFKVLVCDTLLLHPGETHAHVKVWISPFRGQVYTAGLEAAPRGQLRV